MSINENIRLIPVLLLKDNGLYKTVNFTKPDYVGDPINSAKIFNDLGADELILLDIDASYKNKDLNFPMIKAVASECFMPFAYGGGVKNIFQIKKLVKIGVEKIVLNTSAIEDENFLISAIKYLGSQSIIVSIDVRQAKNGNYLVYTKSGTHNTGLDPIDVAKRFSKIGAGEILITSINKDGTFGGYDEKLISNIANNVTVPVIACGGGKDFTSMVKSAHITAASAAAGGSVFIYFSKLKSVLIHYPKQ